MSATIGRFSSRPLSKNTCLASYCKTVLFCCFTGECKRDDGNGFLAGAKVGGGAAAAMKK